MIRSWINYYIKYKQLERTLLADKSTEKFEEVQKFPQNERIKFILGVLKNEFIYKLSYSIKNERKESTKYWE